MHKKLPLLLTITISLLLLCQTAHADFRKALDAYIARDGATMLKEVKDAVDRKNCEGLMLFLMATNMDAATSDYDETTKQSKSTLRAILPQPKWDEMRELLVQAAELGNADALYFLITKSVFKTEVYKKYLNKTLAQTTLKDIASANTFSKKQYEEVERKINNEYILKSNDLIAKAEAGDPVSQMQLGLAYFKSGRYANWDSTQPPAFKQLAKDEAKGSYWLKRAAKSYEISGYEENAGLFSRQMCELLHATANGDKYKLKQAYLWALKGMNELSQPSESWVCLRDMHDSNVLKIAAPEVYAAYTTLPFNSKFNTLFFSTELKELPDWIIEIRKELEKKQLPVFTYYFNDDGNGLKIYADGRVFMGSITKDVLNSEKDMLMKVSPKKVNEFLSALNKIGFYQWTMADTYVLGFGGSLTTQQLVSREKTGWRRMVLVEKYIRDFKEDDIAKMQMTPTRVIEYKKIIESNKKSVVNIRIAKIKTLVEEYFPTQRLRCKLGNSERKQQECIERDKFWLAIAKKEK
jgi:hypothetical protein